MQDRPANHNKFLSYDSVKISLHLRSTENTDEFPKEKSKSPSASEENKVASILWNTKMETKGLTAGNCTKTKQSDKENAI